MWHVESVVVVSHGWAECGLSVFTVMAVSVVFVMSFEAMSITVVWSIMAECVCISVMWCFVVSIMGSTVRILPVKAVFTVIDCFGAWVNISGGHFESSLTCMSLSHIVSVLLFMGLNIASVLSKGM